MPSEVRAPLSWRGLSCVVSLASKSRLREDSGAQQCGREVIKPWTILAQEQIFVQRAMNHFSLEVGGRFGFFFVHHESSVALEQEGRGKKTTHFKRQLH